MILTRRSALTGIGAAGLGLRSWPTGRWRFGAGTRKGACLGTARGGLLWLARAPRRKSLLSFANPEGAPEWRRVQRTQARRCPLRGQAQRECSTMSISRDPCQAQMVIV